MSFLHERMEGTTGEIGLELQSGQPLEHVHAIKIEPATSEHSTANQVGFDNFPPAFHDGLHKSDWLGSVVGKKRLSHGNLYDSGHELVEVGMWHQKLEAIELDEGSSADWFQGRNSVLGLEKRESGPEHGWEELLDGLKEAAQTIKLHLRGIFQSSGSWFGGSSLDAEQGLLLSRISSQAAVLALLQASTASCSQFLESQGPSMASSSSDSVAESCTDISLRLSRLIEPLELPIHEMLSGLRVWAESQSTQHKSQQQMVSANLMNGGGSSSSAAAWSLDGYHKRTVSADSNGALLRNGSYDSSSSCSGPYSMVALGEKSQMERCLWQEALPGAVASLTILVRMHHFVNCSSYHQDPTTASSTFRSFFLCVICSTLRFASASPSGFLVPLRQLFLESLALFMNSSARAVGVDALYPSAVRAGLRAEFLKHFGLRAAGHLREGGLPEERRFWVQLIERQLRHAMAEEGVWDFCAQATGTVAPGIVAAAGGMIAAGGLHYPGEGAIMGRGARPGRLLLKGSELERRRRERAAAAAAERELAVFGILAALARSSRLFLQAHHALTKKSELAQLLRYMEGAAVASYPALASLSAYQYYMEVITDELSWLPFFPPNWATTSSAATSNGSSSSSTVHPSLPIAVRQQQEKRAKRRLKRRALLLSQQVLQGWLLDCRQHATWILDVPSCAVSAMVQQSLSRLESVATTKEQEGREHALSSKRRYLQSASFSRSSFSSSSPRPFSPISDTHFSSSESSDSDPGSGATESRPLPPNSRVASAKHASFGSAAAAAVAAIDGTGDRIALQNEAADKLRRLEKAIQAVWRKHALVAEEARRVEMALRELAQGGGSERRAAVVGQLERVQRLVEEATRVAVEMETRVEVERDGVQRAKRAEAEGRSWPRLPGDGSLTGPGGGGGGGARAGAPRPPNGALTPEQRSMSMSFLSSLHSNLNGFWHVLPKSAQPAAAAAAASHGKLRQSAISSSSSFSFLSPIASSAAASLPSTTTSSFPLHALSRRGSSSYAPLAQTSTLKLETAWPSESTSAGKEAVSSSGTVGWPGKNPPADSSSSASASSRSSKSPGWMLRWGYLEERDGAEGGGKGGGLGNRKGEEVAGLLGGDSEEEDGPEDGHPVDLRTTGQASESSSHAPASRDEAARAAESGPPDSGSFGPATHSSLVPDEPLTQTLREHTTSTATARTESSSARAAPAAADLEADDGLGLAARECSQLEKLQQQLERMGERWRRRKAQEEHQGAGGREEQGSAAAAAAALEGGIVAGSVVGTEELWEGFSSRDGGGGGWGVGTAGELALRPSEGSVCGQSDVHALSTGGVSCGLSQQQEAPKGMLHSSMEQLRDTGADAWRGTQLLSTDISTALRVMRRVVTANHTPTQREMRVLRRTMSDIATMLPISVLLMLPLTPVGHAALLAAIKQYAPSLIPSSFGEERLDIARTLDEVRLSQVLGTPPPSHSVYSSGFGSWMGRPLPPLTPVSLGTTRAGGAGRLSSRHTVVGPNLVQAAAMTAAMSLGTLGSFLSGVAIGAERMLARASTMAGRSGQAQRRPGIGDEQGGLPGVEGEEMTTRRKGAEEQDNKGNAELRPSSVAAVYSTTHGMRPQ